MRAMVAVMAAAALAGCVRPDLRGAEEQVSRFHRALDADDMAGLWALTSARLRSQPSAPGLPRMIADLRRRMGVLRGFQQTDWFVRYGVGGRTLTLRYRATFDRGRIEEQFVFGMGDPAWPIDGYYVRVPGPPPASVPAPATT